MRTIKFRGKSKIDGEWFYGNYFDKDTSGNTHITTLTKGCLVIDPETVGEFTGLKDKKDKEIYEGDIMYSEFSDGSGGYSLIGWNEREASFGMMDAYSYQSKQEGYDFPEFKNYVLIAHLQKALICEVVGNIYDNPELLNVKKS